MPLLWIGAAVIPAGFAWSVLGKGPAPAEAIIWGMCILPWIALGYAAGIGCRE